VINFRDWPLEKAMEYHDPFEIVERLVKPERNNNNDKGAREFWWRFLRPRPELYATIAGLSRVLVAVRVSAHHCIAFAPAGIVYSDRLVVFALEQGAHLALLASTIHDSWAHRPGSTTHETRSTYFPERSFETFPFPPLIESLESIGERYNSYLRDVMAARREGLTATYNRFHSPKEVSQDIAHLRALHVEMDHAVAAAYGWSDLDLDHGFHESKQAIRYTISEAARREVLDRLLALNHERYAQEQATLGSALQPGRKRKKRERATDQAGFFEDR